VKLETSAKMRVGFHRVPIFISIRL